MTPSRHVRARPARPSRRRWLSLALAGVAVLAVVVGTTLATRPPAHTSGCATAPPPLRIVAAPEIAPTVARTVDGNRTPTGRDAACDRPVVVAADPGTVAAALAKSAAARPDVWIPDSSTWTRRQTLAPGVPVQNPSIASSPLVIAVPQDVARAAQRSGGPLTVADLVSRAAAGDMVPWVVGDPARSSAGLGAVIELRAEVATRPNADALITTMFRGSRRDLTPGTTAALAAQAPGALAVPVPEEVLYAHNVARPGDRLVGAYADRARFSFDYPFVVLTTDGARRAQAADVLAKLRTGSGRAVLTQAGFRDPSGAASGPLSTVAGIAAGQPGTAALTTTAALTAAVDAFHAVTLDSKLLVLIDVSGSMAYPVPGAHGATRMDLALQAAINGLALYPDATVVGLWTFSTNLTGSTDYRQVVPYTILGQTPDGSTGRQLFAKGLAQVAVKPHGDTGLYDSVLAAVRAARHAWDPARANSVIVVTDGANDDPAGISLPTLLRTLRAENDPARPVRVYSIAYGPKGDLASLAAISATVGGRAYPARDPRTIGAVLQDAIGRRG